MKCVDMERIQFHKASFTLDLRAIFCENTHDV